MKVKIIPLAPPTTFDQFAEKHELTMVVTERHAAFINYGRYFALFEYSETKDGDMPYSTFGSGDTPEKAIADYANELRGKLLVILPHHPDRREIQCPNEWQGAL